jgi:guanylate kinase
MFGGNKGNEKRTVFIEKHLIKKIMQNIFIISGPAGSGKDSVIDGLIKLLPVVRVITTTTRAPRPGETEGAPYYFVTREQFEQGIAANRFIEHSTNENDALYGVTHEELDRVARSGKMGIWKLEWKGVIAAKKLFPRIVTIYISSSLAILEDRLRKRDGSEKDEVYFRERMAYTREWLKHTDIYDYTVENQQGKIDETIQAVSQIIQKHASLA